MSPKTRVGAESSAELTFRLLLSELKGAAAGTKEPITLFLGAGCSLSSAVDDGTTIASTAGIVASVVDEWLCGPFSEEMTEAELWARFRTLWIKQGIEQRRRAIAGRLEGLRPGAGYRCIARLAERGCLRAIITTNFDLMLDTALEEIPHLKRVGASLTPHREDPRLELVKVHGDIREGGLLFEPRELNRLPADLADRVSELTRGPTLVIGYSGQDHGIMSALCDAPAFNAFWANPHAPTLDEEYYFSPILDWMQKRNSRSNYLYGDILGDFDALLERLEADLEKPHLAPPTAKSSLRNDAVLEILQASPRIVDAAEQLRRAVDDASRQSANGLTPAFASPNGMDAAQRLKDVMRLPGAGRTVRAALQNELAALAFALAIEISARAGLASAKLSAFMQACRTQHETQLPIGQLDESFWSFVEGLCGGSDDPMAPVNLRIHFNHTTKLTLLSECKEPARLRAALRLLHNLCVFAKGDIAPEIASTELGTQLVSIRAKVKSSREDGGATIIAMEPLAADELSFLQTWLIGLTTGGNKKIALKADYLCVETSLLAATAPVSGSAVFAEQVLGAARTSTRAFLGLRDPYGASRGNPIPLSLDETLATFATCPEPGLVIVGASGTGKTTALKTFAGMDEQTSKRVSFVTTPRLSGRSPSLFDLFFPMLQGESPSAVRLALGQLNDHLALHDRTLFLILDGLNEFEAEFDAVRQLYQQVLEFVATLAIERWSQIKIVTTVRSHFFLALRRTATSPPSEYFFSGDRGDRDDAPDMGAVVVKPLTAGEIERVVRHYFKTPTATAFLGLITNIPRLSYDYAHPFLLAVASQVVDRPEDIDLLRHSSLVFQRFADRMLERLGSAEQQNAALTTIHAYFDELITRQDGAVVTEFSLTRGLGRAAAQVVKEIEDARIFQISPVGTIAFAHDRIAEHFLGHYLLHRLDQVDVIATAFQRCPINPVFFGGLRSLVARLLHAAGGVGGEQSLSLVHGVLTSNVLPDGSPTSELLIEALIEFDPSTHLLDRVIDTSTDVRRFRSSLAHGLWRCADHLPIDLLRGHFDSMVASAHADELKAAVPIAFALAALSDASNEDALTTANKELKRIDAASLNSAGRVWIDRAKMLSARLARERGEIVRAIEALRDLFDSQVRQAAWPHAATTALELGRALRDNTAFDEALAVYSAFDEHRAELSDVAAARLALQVATVQKNLVQELKRKGASIPTLLGHYREALAKLDEARDCAKAGRAAGIEVEAAVERIELYLTSRSFVPEGSDLAREAVSEAERLLGFHPRHRIVVVYLRQLAKLASLDGRYQDAIEILGRARQLADQVGRGFYTADCDYQLGHMIAQEAALRTNDAMRELGVHALNSAIAFYETHCAPDNAYKANCVVARESLIASDQGPTSPAS